SDRREKAGLAARHAIIVKRLTIQELTMNRLAILLIFALTLAGCRQSAQNQTPDVDIVLRAEPLAVGETTLVITLTDASGQPVSAQKVEVRGDMSHAGMQPVLAE